MLLQPIDIGIVGAYIVIIMAAGFAMSKLASKNLDSYLPPDCSDRTLDAIVG